MKRFVFIVFLLLSQLLSAQNNPDIKRTMNWYFGWGVGIDFTSGSPVVHTRNDRDYTGDFWHDANYGVLPVEAVWSESDTCGNLLFYSNDKAVFFPDGDTMVKLDPRIINPTQVLAVPKPGNDSVYYFFYFYSGLFDTIFHPFLYGILNVKDTVNPVVSWNNPLFDWGSEMVAGYQHCNGEDMWIVTKKNNCPQLLAYLLTSDGLTTTPVISSVVDLDTINESENGSSLLRFSPDGHFAAAVIRKYPLWEVNTYINIFRFNNCTGTFYDRIVVPFWGAYALCFSPDGTKLYAGGGSSSEMYSGYSPLVQFDLSDYSQQAVQNSMVVIQGRPGIDYFDGMQLGSDGKIYVADYDMTDSTDSLGLTHIGIIQEPNAKGLLCNYEPNVFHLLGRLHYAGFPCYPDSYFRSFDYYDCYAPPEPPVTDESTQVFIPNIFSPNGDGINDVLFVRAKNVEGVELYIYNRWGNQVFRSADINQGWDGTYSGKQTEQGVYFYLLSVRFKNAQEKTFSGNVTLVR